MSTTLRVQWTIIPRTAPQPWLNCSRCRAARPFRSSGKVRVNANARRIDAWLIYRCTACDATWNRPIVERREVSSLESGFLLSLQTNEPGLVRRLAFDVAALRRWTGRVLEFDDVQVGTTVLSPSARPMRLEVTCVVREPIGLRLDRLLASELGVSRSCIQKLERSAQLVTVPQGQGLRRPPRDGVKVVIDASAMPDCSVFLARPRAPS